MSKLRLKSEVIVSAAFIVLIAVIIGSSHRGASHIEVAKETTQCNIIDEPVSGCPKGYSKEQVPRFTERNGEKEFACVAAQIEHKENCTDMLKGGESEQIIIEIPVPAGDESKPEVIKGKT